MEISESVRKNILPAKDMATAVTNLGFTQTAAAISNAGAAHANATGAFGIPLNAFRKDGAWSTAVDATPGSSLLGLAATEGSPLLGNAASGNSKSDYATFTVALPARYVTGEAITIRLRAKIATSLATVSSKVDVDYCKVAGDSLGSDLCATAAQQVTTSYADYDFTITPTARAAGEILVVRVATLNDDTGGTNNKAMSIVAAQLRCTINA